MAILKVINRGKGGTTGTTAGMKNCLKYVLGEEKTDATLTYVDGPFAYDSVTPENVFKAFIDEKKIWGKEGGRQCAHYEVSFHKDENITPEEVYDFAKELFGKIFNGHQFVMAVHTDKAHLHAHAVVNTVSYMDGMKLHVTAGELDQFKQICNAMCRERGLTVAQKGHYFDGRRMGESEFISWNKNSYHQLSKHYKSSHKYKCIKDIEESMCRSLCREDFILRMNERGWQVKWREDRKYITFENDTGFKIRNCTISKELNRDLSKEALENEFRCNRESGYSFEQSAADGAASQYERNIESGIGKQFAQGGAGAIVGAILSGVKNIARASGQNEQGAGRGDSTDKRVARRGTERKHHVGERSEQEYKGIRM